MELTSLIDLNIVHSHKSEDAAMLLMNSINV